MSSKSNCVLSENKLLEKYDGKVPEYYRISELVELFGFADRSGADHFCRRHNISRYRYSLSRDGKSDTNEPIQEAIVIKNELGGKLLDACNAKMFKKYPALQYEFPTAYGLASLTMSFDDDSSKYNKRASVSKLHEYDTSLFSRPIGNRTPLPDQLKALIEDLLVRHLEQHLKNFGQRYPKKTVPRTIKELKLKPDGNCVIPNHVLAHDPMLQKVISLIMRQQKDLYALSVSDLMLFLQEVEDLYPNDV